MTRRIILGNLGGGAYGLKISKPGYDVFTATPSNMLFDSAMPYYRLRATYNFVFAPNAAAQQIINHNLGVVPLCLFSSRTASGGASQTAIPVFTSPNQLFVGTPGTTSSGAATRYVKVHLLTEVVQ